MYYDVSKIVSINKQKINRNDGDNHLMTIQPQLCQVEDLPTAGLPLDGEYSGLHLGGIHNYPAVLDHEHLQ